MSIKYPYTDFHEMNLDWTLETVKKAEEQSSDAVETANSAREDVDNFFENLDLQEEVNNKITEMAYDGGLARVIDPLVPGPVDEWLTEHITPGTGTVLDSSLRVEGAAAESKAVGDQIYGAKNMADYTAKPLTANLDDIASITSVVDMPVNTFFSAVGEDVQPLLTSSFTWTLQTGVTYTVKKFPRTNYAYEVFVYSGNMQELYVCRPVSGNPVWEKVPTGISYEEPIEFSYTDFDITPGTYLADGTLDPDGYHSQMLRINPGKPVYLPPMAQLPGKRKCAFFDKWGSFISMATVSNLVTVQYRKPDGYGTATYQNIYMITAPTNAYFISQFFPPSGLDYKCFIQSKPCFGFTGSGNYLWTETYPAYQANKNKKVCVIGASSVMVGRSYRLINENYEVLIGYQEYLWPWVNLLESYGYSGTPWGNVPGSTDSIYNQIVTLGVDLSGYDTFILGYSLNGANTTNMGRADSTDVTTVMGGYNGVIDYIYSQVPKAKIYIMNLWHNWLPGNPHPVADLYNTRIPELCTYRGCELLDLEHCSGINTNNISEYTYDNTHPNQYGMQNIGQYIRKQIIGI